MAGKWPDLPVGIKMGVAARIADKILVGLGTAGQALFALDINNPAAGWRECAPFIGTQTNGAASVAMDGKLYIFGGNGKAHADAASPVIYDTCFAYDLARDTWQMIDTVTPAGLSGARAMATLDRRVLFAGGYNKRMFDAHLHAVSTIDRLQEPEKYATLVEGYMSHPPEDYGWNAALLTFDPAMNIWGTMGDSPTLPTCDAACVALGNDQFLLVNGEIKPGLRTDAVTLIEITSEGATWEQVMDLPPARSEPVQEGLAGAYVGLVGDTVLLAGGTNFPGARANSRAGKWYAHKGLTKAWRDEIYALKGGVWSQVGTLPEGMAYGASFSLEEGMLLVGGEDGAGASRSSVRVMRWDGATITFSD